MNSEFLKASSALDITVLNGSNWVSLYFPFPGVTIKGAYLPDNFDLSKYCNDRIFWFSLCLNQSIEP